MTEKRRRIKITIDKFLLMLIIDTTENGQSLDDRITELLKKGLEATGKL
jgi:hypothetical protein